MSRIVSPLQSRELWPKLRHPSWSVTGDTILPHIPSHARDCNEKVIRVVWRQCDTRDTVENNHGQAQREVHRRTKISIINNPVNRLVSEIKLIKTDTTLDLSRKAEIAEEKKKRVKVEGDPRPYIDIP